MTAQSISTSTNALATAYSSGQLVAYSASGDALVVWYDGSNVKWSYASSPYTSWTTASLITSISGRWEASLYKLSNDNALLVCSNGSGNMVSYLFTYSSGSHNWSAGSAVTVLSSGGAFNGGSVTMDMDAQGRIWAAWSNNSHVVQVYYTTNNGTSWNSSTTFTQVSGGDDTCVNLAYIGNYIVVAFCGASAVWKYARIDAHSASLGSWSSATTISNCTMDNTVTSTCLRGAGSSNYGILCGDFGSIPTQNYNSNTDTWSSVTSIGSSSDKMPTLITDGTDLYCVWSKFSASNNFSLVFKKWVASTQTWDSASTQLEANGSNIARASGGFGNNNLAFAYTVGTASPWTVYFDTYSTSNVITNTRTISSVTAALQVTSARTIGTVTAALQVTNIRTIGTVTASVQVTGTRTLSSVTAAILTTNIRTLASVTAALQVTNARTISSVTAALQVTNTRTIGSVTAALLSTSTRTIASVTSALLTTNTRTISPATAALLVASTRTIASMTASLLVTSSRTITATAALLVTGQRTILADVSISVSGTSFRTITPVTAAILVTSTRTIGTVTAALQVTSVRAILSVTAALQTTNTRTISAPSAAVQVTSTRTLASVTAALLITQTRSILATSAILVTLQRSILSDAAISIPQSNTRTIMGVTAAVLVTNTRTIALSASISSSVVIIPNATVIVHSGQAMAMVASGEASATMSGGRATTILPSGEATATVTSGQATIIRRST